MTPNQFRKLALRLPGTEERMHMQHPDFRVAGKIFATLGYPDKARAMVKVTPVEQEMLVQAEPDVFSPVKGKWGLKGCTSVALKEAQADSIRRALQAAWELHAPAEARGLAEGGVSPAKGLPPVRKSVGATTRRKRR